MKISEMKENEGFGIFPTVCFLCGEHIKTGGYHHGYTDLSICLRCLDFDDLRALGILFGDAILDLYKNLPYRRKTYPTGQIKSILDRLEKAIYRAVADGFYQQYVSEKRQQESTENIEPVAANKMN